MRVTCRACRFRRCWEAGMNGSNILTNATSTSSNTTAVVEADSSHAVVPCTSPAAAANIFPQGVFVASTSHEPTYGPYPNLHKYQHAIKSFYNAQRSLYFAENPRHVFSEASCTKILRAGFEANERRNAPLIYQMVNEHFLPLTQIPSETRKRVFKRFCNGFTEMFSYWLTVNTFPESTNSLFVSHYGYYIDYSDLERFFADLGTEANEHFKLAKPLLDKSLKTQHKFQELAVSEMELAALVALWFYAVLDRHDLLTTDVKALQNAVLEELGQFLTATIGADRVPVRIGCLLLFLQNLTELMVHFNDYVIMGKLFVPDEFYTIWDEEAMV